MIFFVLQDFRDKLLRRCSKVASRWLRLELPMKTDRSCQKPRVSRQDPDDPGCQNLGERGEP